MCKKKKSLRNLLITADRYLCKEGITWQQMGL